MARPPQFDHHMSEVEGLMWRLEKDPYLSSTVANITVLDRPVDFDRFRQRLDRAAHIVPRLRQRVQARAGEPHAAHLGGRPRVRPGLPRPPRRPAEARHHAPPVRHGHARRRRPVRPDSPAVGVRGGRRVAGRQGRDHPEAASHRGRRGGQHPPVDAVHRPRPGRRGSARAARRRADRAGAPTAAVGPGHAARPARRQPAHAHRHLPAGHGPPLRPGPDPQRRA